MTRWAEAYQEAGTFSLLGDSEPPQATLWRPHRELDFHTHLKAMKYSNHPLPPLGLYQRRPGGGSRIYHHSVIMRPNLCRFSGSQVETITRHHSFSQPEWYRQNSSGKQELPSMPSSDLFFLIVSTETNWGTWTSTQSDSNDMVDAFPAGTVSKEAH